MTKQHSNLIIIMTLILFLVTLYISFIVGTIPISIEDIWNKIVTGQSEQIDSIIDLRIPRIIIAVLAGVMLSISGLLLQAVLQNPLAEANILGVSTGALIARNLFLMIVPQLYHFIPYFSFLGGIIPFLVLFILSIQFKLPTTRMILVGVAMYALLSGVLDLFNQNPFLKLPQGLTMKTWNDVKLIGISAMIGLILTFVISSKINLLALEEKQANNIGFNIKLYRLLIGLVAVYLASATASIIGPLAFVGLIVPHISKKILGNNHQFLLIYTMILGAWLVLVADLLGRTIHPPLEIPANAITMIIGGPVLIYIICKGAVNHASKLS